MVACTNSDLFPALLGSDEEAEGRLLDRWVALASTRYISLKVKTHFHLRKQVITCTLLLDTGCNPLQAVIAPIEKDHQAISPILHLISSTHKSCVACSLTPDILDKTPRGGSRIDGMSWLLLNNVCSSLCWANHVQALFRPLPHLSVPPPPPPTFHFPPPPTLPTSHSPLFPPPPHICLMSPYRSAFLIPVHSDATAPACLQCHFAVQGCTWLSSAQKICKTVTRSASCLPN